MMSSFEIHFNTFEIQAYKIVYEIAF